MHTCSTLFFSALGFVTFAVGLPTELQLLTENDLESLSLPTSSPSTSYLPTNLSSHDREQGWMDPRTNGGRFLDFTIKRFGEPLNIIVSALSDPYVLTTQGFSEYAKSIGFSEECLHLHLGTPHYANLGDGMGAKSQLLLAREVFFPGARSWWGTCWESLVGGHHFRAWKQEGTGAWFIGASLEQSSARRHMIATNGYNRGRDWLIERAVPGSRWDGRRWSARVEWRTGLLEPGNKSVNHEIAQDGRVAILTVQTAEPVGSDMFFYKDAPRSFAAVAWCSLVLVTVVVGLYCLCVTWVVYPLVRTLALAYARCH